MDIFILFLTASWCSAVEDVTYGTVSSHKASHGTVITINCNEGYELPESAGRSTSMTCRDSQWSIRQPTICHRKAFSNNNNIFNTKKYVTLKGCYYRVFISYNEVFHSFSWHCHRNCQLRKNWAYFIFKSPDLQLYGMW